MSRLGWILVAIVGGGLILLLLGNSENEAFGLGGDNAARALYLGIWGAVLAAGILGSGMRLGYVARSLAVWLLIILALIAGYQYRYELQDVASRVTAGLIPGSPLALGVDDAGHATVTLEKRPNGHFEARVMVDGAEVPVVVDTGATSTVLTQRDAERAGFDPARLNYSVPISTANGMARAAVATAKEISLGGIVRRNVPVMVTERGMLDQSLLGMNFIGTLSGFDMRGDRMILRD